jgi:hypothetical protein
MLDLWSRAFVAGVATVDPPDRAGSLNPTTRSSAPVSFARSSAARPA